MMQEQLLPIGAHLGTKAGPARVQGAFAHSLAISTQPSKQRNTQCFPVLYLTSNCIDIADRKCAQAVGG